MRKLAKWAVPVVLLNVGVVSAAGPKAYSAGQFALSLDGKLVGTLASVEGGALVGEVVRSTEDTASPIPKKHLGNPTHEDLKIQLNLNAARPAYDWIDSAWTGRGERKQVVLTQCDHNGKALSDRQFDATLSEVTFPKLTGASKSGGLLTLSLKPDSSSPGKGSSGCSNVSDSKKNFWTGKFRVELDKMDTSGVISMESFTVSTVAATGGGQRGADVMVQGNSVTFPNLKLAVATHKAADFEKWFEDFVVKGNNGDEHEKGGAIILEDASLKELARVTLGNVGISRFSLKSDNTGQSLPVFEVELYVETIRLSMDGAKPKPSEFTAQAVPTKVRPAKAPKKRKK